MRAAATFLLAALLAAPAAAFDCTPPGVGRIFLPPAPCYRIGAVFDQPTGRYPHGVLGDAIEYGALIAHEAREEAAVELPASRVFEDIAPRLADIGGTDKPEIIVVESDAERGAMLAIYRASFVDGYSARLRRVAATEPIGTRFRWLAPAGIADFDGDGQNDIAYVETPHLAGILRIVTLRDGALVEIAAARPGFSNHRIGEAFISGGLRDCGQGPEIVVADSGWRRVLAARLVAGRIETVALGPMDGSESLAAALDCAQP